MNRRDVLALVALAGPGVGLRIETAAAQSTSIKDQLVGAWTLLSQDSIGKDGSRTPLLGPKPSGTLVVAPSGRYAMILIDTMRPKWADKAGLRSMTTPEEYASAAKGLVAQYGTLSVDESTKTITRMVDGALGPNAPGKVGKWAVVKISGEDLVVESAEGQVSAMNGGRITAAFTRTK